MTSKVKILQDTFLFSLEDKINSYIENGWYIAGDIHCITLQNGSSTNGYIIMMVKDDEVELQAYLNNQ